MKIAVFASGNGTNFTAIQQAVADEALHVTIEFVFCDQPHAKVIERAQLVGIPYYHFAPKNFPTKAAFEEQLVTILEEHDVEYVILAGYMRLIGSVLLARYPNRIVNIHPSLLPAYPGTKSIKEAYEAGVTQSGITIHYIDEGIDTGPIICQKVVPRYPEDTFAAFEERIHAMEHRIYPQIIEEISQHKGVSDEKTSVN